MHLFTFFKLYWSCFVVFFFFFNLLFLYTFSVFSGDLITIFSVMFGFLFIFLVYKSITDFWFVFTMRFLCSNVCVYTCMCMCIICMCVYIHTHTHTHTHTHPYLTVLNCWSINFKCIKTLHLCYSLLTIIVLDIIFYI